MKRILILIPFLLICYMAWAGTLTVSGPGGTTNSGTTNQTAVYTGSTTISSSSVETDNGTNVGIGSATPGTILDVQGTIRATAYDGTLYTNSNIGIGTTTINWNNGYAQNVGIGTSSGAYIKFTAPTGSGIANLHLRILQDGTGSRPLPNFSNVSNLNWCTGTAPVLSTTAAAYDWLDFRYYGGNYDGCATTGF